MFVICVNAHHWVELTGFSSKCLRDSDPVDISFLFKYQGRNGLGSVFVFAAGNGGYAGDCCSFNGLVNSIYTIAITGVNKDGSVPRYAEPCPGIMAVTYSKSWSRSDNSKVVGNFCIYSEVYAA